MDECVPEVGVVEAAWEECAVAALGGAGGGREGFEGVCWGCCWVVAFVLRLIGRSARISPEPVQGTIRQSSLQWEDVSVINGFVQLFCGGIWKD